MASSKRPMGVIATLVLAASIALLASSIFYFGSQLMNLESTLHKVTEEVAEVRRLMPDILDESAQIRGSTASVIAESEAIRGQIPDILAEVKAVREAIPPIMLEIEKNRQAIPGMLDRADTIVSGAEDVGKNASQAVVSGFFTGLLTAPITVAKGLSNQVLGTDDLTREDILALNEAGKKLLTKDKVGDVQIWQNEDSGLQGQLTLVSNVPEEERECRLVKIEAERQDNKLVDTEVTTCKQASGEWELKL
ncbi:hypothetical protein MIB92_15655 [Aestuariirhabdus sp. Z084]|uniref:RT0821/Lpp0805 family surface protein n=1 Tax=Aestuariirhabdus haliotis TaxID=2918751 RepID=UPI0020C071BB|nr:RT0821/Lpp0805 family surface protein [Aestuariirhabdus haliotis]MCL6417097.1 hypothetical protein [Aestuariirhabdus haliotis]